jgi:5-methylcytosine-specific restriction endonuclease McrA
VEEKVRRYFGKQLRRLFYRSPIRSEVFRTLPSRCNECQEHFDKCDLQVDHLEPVVPTDRHVGSLEYFMRMFTFNRAGQLQLENLLLLCRRCHKAKSAAEMTERARNKTGPYSEAAKARRLKKKKRKSKR